MRSGVLVVILSFGIFYTSVSLAVETAPRISDREIVERLAKLEEGQRNIDKRFDDVNRRFGDVNRRFDDVNRRFDDVNRRLDDIMTFLQILVGVLSVVGVGIFGSLIFMWRRVS